MTNLSRFACLVAVALVGVCVSPAKTHSAEPAAGERQEKALPFDPQALALDLLALQDKLQAEQDIAPHEEDDETAIDEMVINEQPPFLVHVEADNPMREYRSGDHMALDVRSEKDAYLYVLYQQVDGQVFQIFPNNGQRENRVAAGETIRVPGEDALFRWKVGPPFGKENVKVIASVEPLDELSDPRLTQAQFNAVDSKQLARTARSLKQAEASSWAEVDLELETFSPNQNPGGPGARRFGVYFGISNHRYSDLADELTEGEWNPELRGCHLDAQNMAKTLGESGRFTDQRVFVNDQATRANMEWAVTQWLPEVSRPGDTVVFSFSGHGGQIADDNGDERIDGQDEYLCPHDYMLAQWVVALAEKVQQGEQVPAEQLAQLKQIAAAIQGVNDEEQILSIITRTTCVTDDLFSRWLQRLSGRQIVVMIDSCHSGGFAVQEKSLDARRAAAGSFDFLASEGVRLKDIGQPEQAIITAAKATQESLEMPDGQAGVMTYFFLESVKQLDGPVRIEHSYEFCKAAMEQFYIKLNEQIESQGMEPWPAHQPHMKNYCTAPVILKPE